MVNQASLGILKELEGEVETSALHRSVYATDASVYREIPLAVCYPKTESDIQKIIQFASKNKIGIIPRGGGTSLAGQCVGTGLVVDLSRHFNKILEFNPVERWVKVQPGLVRDELNRLIASSGLHFGPNTSTANRCTIGGMYGNNSSGTSSIKYGTTRDKTLAAKIFTNDAHPLHLSSAGLVFTNASIQEKINKTKALCQDESLIQAIAKYFPSPDIHRRNSGYALDNLIQNSIENTLVHVFAGSEGTLGICTELTLQLDPLPDPEVALICPHFNDVVECLEAVKPIMEHDLNACEMMDDIILSCTEASPLYADKRFFIQGNPKAVLLLEIRAESTEALQKKTAHLLKTIQEHSKAYAISEVYGNKSKEVWELRKAGLGLLANLSGDKKAVACIEDTAVSLDVLPQYIAEFTEIMKHFGQEAVYYAHAGAGEIHLRPILDLRSSKGKSDFRSISTAVAHLVKKYNGSLSGEHGDGRVRAEFLELVYGKTIYQAFEALKKIWDEHNIFNPGKIVQAPKMDEAIRDQIPLKQKLHSNHLNPSIDVLKIADQCNGSGDCRKGPEALGQMCPSYHASNDEIMTTRARANAFREFHKAIGDEIVQVDEHDLHQILAHCVSCKACSKECPSSVDMGLLKLVFEEHYYQKQFFNWSRYFFGHIHLFNKIGKAFPKLSNSIIQSNIGGRIIKSMLEIHPARTLPLFKSSKALKNSIGQKGKEKTVVLLLDEFNTANRPHLFEQAKQVIQAIGYQVHLVKLQASGRALLSKGYIGKAEKQAIKNLKILKPYITQSIPIISLEPSVLSCFWDEYQKINQTDKSLTKQLSAVSFSFGSFIYNCYAKQEFEAEVFDQLDRKILLHTHCHEKALGDMDSILNALSIPKNHIVQEVNSACCGMAGSYGYQKDNYEMSVKMAEVKLIPSINEKSAQWIIAGQGVSCCHQMEELTQRKVWHPVEIFFKALRKTGA